MFWEKFYNLCEMSGKKPNPVGKELGASSGLITRWKQGIVMPDAEMLTKIADYFGCTVDYLLDRSEDVTHLEDQSLTTDETKLLDRFRELDDEGKEEVLHTALAELRRMRADRGEGTAAVG